MTDVGCGTAKDAIAESGRNDPSSGSKMLGPHHPARPVEK